MTTTDKLSSRKQEVSDGAFRAGDRVRWYNPPLCEGTVLKNNGGFCKVHWDNGVVRRERPEKLRPAATGLTSTGTEALS